MKIKYEVIARAVVRDKSSLPRHYLKLLYRGDGTPWWACSPSMDLPIPEDFPAKPGEIVTLTLSVEG